MFSVLPGGKYSARQNSDGTWDVMDVPFFAEVPKGIKGAPRDITEDDLRDSVDTHRRKYSEDSFLPRLNVLHNYGIHRPMPAGFFLPRSVRPFRMGGKHRPVVFADLLAIPDEVFRRMDRGELPYRSAEVRTYEPLTFGALALLDTEPPHFEFPLMLDFDKSELSVVRLDDGGPTLAYAATGTDGPSAFLFRFAEDDMPDDEKKPDEKDPGDGKMAEGEGDLKGAISAIEAKMKEFTPLLELLPKLQEMLAGAGEEEESIEQEPADEPVAAMSATPAGNEDEATQMQARVSALESYRASNEHEKKVDKTFSSAVDSLESEGYALTDAIKGRIRSAAESGEETLKLFTDTFRETVPKDPPAERSSTGSRPATKRGPPRSCSTPTRARRGSPPPSSASASGVTFRTTSSGRRLRST
jgi:hypothetical protein